MEPRFHIPGTEQFGYSMVNRYLFSFHVYMNTVKRICKLYPNASVNNIKGYIAYYCYIRLKSFDTFLKVVVEHKDYVTANCILRMLGDNVAIFRLIYMEPNFDNLILRHCLYEIDGCERSLTVLPGYTIKENKLIDAEMIEANAIVQTNVEHRKKRLEILHKMLSMSPLKQIDNKTFNRIVEDRNWKFKEFKNYKKIRDNQYQWRELYNMIGYCEGFDLLSYLSQYTHGLSMSNLVIQLDDRNCDEVIAEALGLLDRMNQYVLNFYDEDNVYILSGLLEPETRDKLLACYDDKHRPTIAEWERRFMPWRT